MRSTTHACSDKGDTKDAMGAFQQKGSVSVACRAKQHSTRVYTSSKWPFGMMTMHCVCLPL